MPLHYYVTDTLGVVLSGHSTYALAHNAFRRRDPSATRLAMTDHRIARGRLITLRAFCGLPCVTNFTVIPPRDLDHAKWLADHGYGTQAALPTRDGQSHHPSQNTQLRIIAAIHGAMMYGGGRIAESDYPAWVRDIARKLEVV